jgi:hypothetical protein
MAQRGAGFVKAIGSHCQRRPINNAGQQEIKVKAGNVVPITNAPLESPVLSVAYVRWQTDSGGARPYLRRSYTRKLP